MKQAEHENLSALMDGELDSHQFRFMLRRMDAHASLTAAWERYHLVGDSLRHDLHGLADADMAGRIMREIEAAPGTRTRHASHRWLRWSAGGAIAAGVAVAALVVVQPQMGKQPMQAARSAVSTDAGTVATSGKDAASSSTDVPMSAPTVPRWLSASPAAAQLAQPAAANFSPRGQFLGHSEPSGYYSPGLAPYMTIPHSNGGQVVHRESRHWWIQTPPPRQPVTPRGWRLQAQ